MGTVRNRTQAALREYVYEDLGSDQLGRKLRRIEEQTTGGNPHNIGMATFEFVNSGAITDQTEQEIKQVLADSFPDHKLPGAFPEKWDEE
jgi:hypothetical protein